ncbi:hypothetical protein K1Y77_17185 (plasmid) [Halomonas qaidamensis]|uniref:Uncharacterized protein n=1 Tax=Halomonas qaidamensis TaxID=2866211 RepID=A0ABY6JUG0_9GAMM|nr:hypothetical protein [Halomonas qaidamensis]UYV20953.1 hypothetical protein K1Y77_17185 [Halomonas qaidamensis]
MASEEKEQLEKEWIENVQTWFYKDNLWGGVVFAREGDDVKVTVTNYMKLTRTVSATFSTYEDALGTIGFYIDEYLEEQRAWLEAQK